LNGSGRFCSAHLFVRFATDADLSTPSLPKALGHLKRRFGAGQAHQGHVSVSLADGPYLKWQVHDMVVRFSAEAAEVGTYVPPASKTKIRVALGMSKNAPRKLPTKEVLPAKKDKDRIAREAEILKTSRF
jgi:hypothetical protein